MKANYLVCYDISDPKRLGRVIRHMKGKGLHIEYSVWYCSLTWPELNALKQALRGMIDDEKDDVRIYPLPSKVRVRMLGVGARIPEGVDLFMGASSSLDRPKHAQPIPKTGKKPVIINGRDSTKT